MSLKTLNVEKLQEATGNIYESIVILSKRARQIAAREKMELDEKLKYFEGFEDEEEFAFNEEQERISKDFERRPHPTQRAVVELDNDKVSFRKPEQL
ncbi:MAG: DNA-directed RNA polymerase subunit omega [Bacteroidetes bacterium]|nr:DNA-directed RNA polymerase subunit omega [Bacteroidota bacterium]MCH8524379.1 DNA-directed RNA polymerase subunit omega [Balneolales bacterium]